VEKYHTILDQSVVVQKALPKDQAVVTPGAKKNAGNKGQQINYNNFYEDFNFNTNYQAFNQNIQGIPSHFPIKRGILK
jgi:hypothetical protein